MEHTVILHALNVKFPTSTFAKARILVQFLPLQAATSLTSYKYSMKIKLQTCLQVIHHSEQIIPLFLC